MSCQVCGMPSSWKVYETPTSVFVLCSKHDGVQAAKIALERIRATDDVFALAD